MTSPNSRPRIQLFNNVPAARIQLFNNVPARFNNVPARAVASLFGSLLACSAGCWTWLLGI